MASGPVCRTSKAEHMAAPTNAANVKKLLPTRSRPHMAHRCVRGAATFLVAIRLRADIGRRGC